MEHFRKQLKWVRRALLAVASLYLMLLVAGFFVLGGITYKREGVSLTGVVSVYDENWISAECPISPYLPLAIYIALGDPADEASKEVQKKDASFVTVPDLGGHFSTANAEHATPEQGRLIGLTCENPPPVKHARGGLFATHATSFLSPCAVFTKQLQSCFAQVFNRAVLMSGRIGSTWGCRQSLPQAPTGKSIDYCPQE